MIAQAKENSTNVQYRKAKHDNIDDVVQLQASLHRLRQKLKYDNLLSDAQYVDK